MEVASQIEPVLLRPDSSEEEIRLLCMAARKHRLVAVGVPPVWARFAVTALAGSPVRVDVPVGYPLGTHTASVKGLETRLALEEGAAEVSFVPNLAAYKSGLREIFRQDVAYALKQSRLVNEDALLKVLLYLDLLSTAEQREVVRIIRESGGRFLVLATHSGAPVTPELVRRIQAFLDPGVQVGVMGEVRTWEEATALLSLGVGRLATPWGMGILQQVTIEG